MCHAIACTSPSLTPFASLVLVYTWTRDSALTTHGLVEVATASQQPQVISFVNDYITAQGILQQTSNPSGSFSDLSGLGEPKFNIDETAFTGAWGR